MVNVVVVRQNPSGGLISDEPVTLRNVSTLETSYSGSGVPATLLELTDVASNGSIANGSTIVYYASNNTFVVEPLPFQDISTLDCGSF